MRVVFKLVVVALVAATFSSCLKPQTSHGDLGVIMVDSCEYVYLQNGRHGIALVHKANCVNHSKSKHCVFCHSDIYYND